MKSAVFWGLLILARVIQADQRSEDPLQSSAETQQKQGRLMTVSVTLGNPVRIFVTGREELKLDLSKMKLTVRRLHPYPQQELKVNREGNFYTVINREAETHPFQELEVTTSIYKTSETFKFKMDEKKP